MYNQIDFNSIFYYTLDWNHIWSINSFLNWLNFLQIISIFIFIITRRNWMFKLSSLYSIFFLSSISSFSIFLSNSFIKFIVNETSFHVPSVTNQFKNNIFHNTSIVLNVVLLLHRPIYLIIFIINILLNHAFVVKWSVQ